eukprot:CAMPEP_0201577584 /NCGR_PEP_ID=MMETSP0190_2-20130828/24031_1 /ASSEMBLY_ACC=CAM_ASM_000263 /TAXON_ID=37353 /ORGANISM="Rosalina sp." /LENGTH=382 /DNA_ID=CAMNT_0048009763 /DNA_START=121 /DNA_END=1269 /DNA_ORIENTATION=+
MTDDSNYKSLEKNVKVPKEMQAIIVNPDTKKLGLQTVDVPKLRAQEVLIKIEASAVNRADLLQASGKYPPPKGESTIIGLECSGTIVDYSDDCVIAGKSKAFDIGSKVMALLPGGGYSQYVNVLESHLIPVPEDISFEIAAAIPEAFLTAFQLLFWYGKPEKFTYSDNKQESKQDDNDGKDNDVVLIHAGGSGVGTTLIQYCREYGLNAFITAGSKEKIDFCIKLGAKAGANYKEQAFDEVLLENYKNGANIILDCVGASHWHKNLNSIALDGRFVSYGFLSGASVKPLNESDPTFSIVPILRKRISIIGTTLRSRSKEYKSELIADFTKRIVNPLVATKRIAPIVSRVFEMKNANEAHEFVRSNKNIGKVILSWDASQCKL